MTYKGRGIRQGGRGGASRHDITPWTHTSWLGMTPAETKVPWGRGMGLGRVNREGGASRHDITPWTHTSWLGMTPAETKVPWGRGMGLGRVNWEGKGDQGVELFILHLP